MLEIQRRYNDFDWLHQRLRVEYPHVLIPPIPVKSIMNRFNAEFIISRCKSLQQFLICVFNHKELRHSDSLKVFLAETDEEFQNLRSRLTSNSTSKEIFSSLVDSVVNGKITSTVVEPDPWYDSVKSYINNFEIYIQKTHKVVTEMIQKEQEQVQALLQFSEAAATYAAIESGQDKTLQYQYQTTSRVLQQIATLRKEQCTSQEPLEEQLSNYMNIIPAAKELLGNRNQILQNYFQFRDKSSAIMEKLISAEDGRTRKDLEKDLVFYEEKTNESGSDFRAFSRKSKVEFQAHFYKKKNTSFSFNTICQLFIRL